MKLKRRIGIGLAVAAATYCVLAYIFMWPPVVRYYWSCHRATSSASACVNNLRQIDAAIEQFALEHGKHTGDPVTANDITPYIKLNSQGQIPPCPAGGTYTYGIVGRDPTCSLGTNPPIRIRVDYFFWNWSTSIHHRLTQPVN